MEQSIGPWPLSWEPDSPTIVWYPFGSLLRGGWADRGLGGWLARRLLAGSNQLDIPPPGGVAICLSSPLGLDFGGFVQHPFDSLLRGRRRGGGGLRDGFPKGANNKKKTVTMIKLR